MPPHEPYAGWRIDRVLVRRPTRVPPLTVGFLSFATFAVGLATCAIGSPSVPSWPGVRQEIASRFPGVVSIGTQELANWLADPNRARPLILDVRAREEYEVSHLPGAIWAGTAQRQTAAVKQVPSERSVVLYCSVGWRSAQAAAQLMKEGRRSVLNLDGSLFQWANERRPLIDDRARSVHVAHPYNQAWGSLLDRRLWSHDPSSWIRR